jgi:hypothetical protein
MFSNLDRRGGAGSGTKAGRMPSRLIQPRPPPSQPLPLLLTNTLPRTSTPQPNFSPFTFTLAPQPTNTQQLPYSQQSTIFLQPTPPQPRTITVLPPEGSGQGSQIFQLPEQSQASSTQRFFDF